MDALRKDEPVAFSSHPTLIPPGSGRSDISVVKRSTGSWVSIHFKKGEAPPFLPIDLNENEKQFFGQRSSPSKGSPLQPRIPPLAAHLKPLYTPKTYHPIHLSDNERRNVFCVLNASNSVKDSVDYVSWSSTSDDAAPLLPESPHVSKSPFLLPMRHTSLRDLTRY